MASRPQRAIGPLRNRASLSRSRISRRTRHSDKPANSSRVTSAISEETLVVKETELRFSHQNRVHRPQDPIESEAVAATLPPPEQRCSWVVTSTPTLPTVYPSSLMTDIQHPSRPKH